MGRPSGPSQLAVTQSEFSRVLVVNKRASSLSAGENAFCFEKIERLAHRTGANAKLSRQLSFVRDYAARLPFAGHDPRQECVAQLHITEGVLKSDFTAIAAYSHTTLGPTSLRKLASACGVKTRWARTLA
jgi:hypothetical protein